MTTATKSNTGSIGTVRQKEQYRQKEQQRQQNSNLKKVSLTGEKRQYGAFFRKKKPFLITLHLQRERVGSCRRVGGQGRAVALLQTLLPRAIVVSLAVAAGGDP